CEIDTSLPSLRVIRALDELVELRGAPQRLRLDNGPDEVDAARCRIRAAPQSDAARHVLGGDGPCGAVVSTVRGDRAALSERTGRRRSRAVGLERMLRIHFLQQLYALSDPAVEEALYDSTASGGSWASTCGVRVRRRRRQYASSATCERSMAWSSRYAK